MLSKKKKTNTIRIGTRSSALALWQAKTVEDQLKAAGYNTKIVPVKSTGDIVLDKPLYELGITGIFTRTLDIAMLNEDVDIAVHSLKDVPTILPKGICQAAVLKRGSFRDILVTKEKSPNLQDIEEGIIATGSLRRKAQWLNKYPNYSITDLRGNVNSRLKKLENSNWVGAIFAEAGLKRLDILPENTINLEWMIPAPAQGAIMITAMETDEFSRKACAKLNDEETALCTTIERTFLNKLEGGCTAPIGAFAYFEENTIRFKGILLSEDGRVKLEVQRTAAIEDHEMLTHHCVEEILSNGGKELMSSFNRKQDQISLYSTKKLSEVQQALIHSNLNIDSSNFIEAIPCSFNYPENSLEHVIITSKNAVKSIANNEEIDFSDFKNIYCVGKRTKKLIESHSGKVVFCAENSKALADYLVENSKGIEITYFCGDLRLNYLPAILKENGFNLEEIITYKTELTPSQVSKDIQGVLFYSPSTVKSYILQNKSAEKMAFCIGQTTANEASKHFKNVKVSELPTVESVIELVNQNYV